MDRDRFHAALGEALRRARRSRGLTLRDIETKSQGFFRASVLGGYERGERSVSLYRFVELADLFELAPDELMGEVMATLIPEARKKIVIDLDRVSLLGSEHGRAVASFTHEIQARRGDYLSSVISLRGRDIHEMALRMHVRPEALVQRLQPVLK